MRNTAIITDSIATIPSDLADTYDIGIVPLHVTFGGQTYRDGVEMTSDQFFHRLSMNNMEPTTSAPAIGELVAAFNEAATKAETVVAIHASGALTATRDASLQAAELVDVPVHVVDSKTGAAAQGLVVLEAARAALAGASPEEVLQRAQELIERVRLLIMMDTLKYLARGGRIGSAQAWLGTALRFKPIITLAEGKIAPVDRPRSRPRAIDRLFELMAEDVGEQPVHVAVTQGAALAEAETLRDRIGSRFDCRDLVITEFTPVMGAHTGPGVLGIAYWTEQEGA